MLNSPAAESGFQTGDVIRLVQGERVRNFNAFRKILAGFPPGKKVTFTVLRGEVNKELVVTLGKRP